MAENVRHMTRQELLDAIEKNWGTYIPTLQALSDEDQARFAQQEGFNSLKDFLAHICAWWQKALEVIPRYQRGEIVQDDWSDVDAFNARAVERYRDQTLEQIEEDFENLYSGLSGLIAELPDEAFDNPNIYQWVYENVVEHYEEHLPPGDPQIPAEQYGGRIY